MKNRFIRMFTVICAAIFMACTVSVWAFAEDIPATSTDLPAAEEQRDPEIPGEKPQPGEQEEQKEPATDPVPEEQEKPAEPEMETPELVPEDKPEEIPAEEQTEQSEDNQEGPAEGEEIIITKKLLVGQSWNGKVSKKKPAILKLDVNRSQSVHVLVEGKNVWVIVEKTDRITENPPRTETDPETKRTVISWNAQAGSYLITLGPVEPNPMAKATVTIMDDKAFEAWEAKQEEEPETAEESESEEETAQEETAEPEEENKPEEETEPVEESETDKESGEETEPTEETESEPEEEQPKEETEPESEKQSQIDVEPEEEAEPAEEAESEPEEEQPEEVTKPEEEAESEPEEEQPEEATEPEEEAESEPEEEQIEENRPESEMRPEREIDVDITWDVPNPVIGDTAHFNAILTGYEGLNFTVQWQYGPDKNTWYDIAGATDLTMDVVVTEENNIVYWRVLVFVEDEQGI